MATANPPQVPRGTAVTANDIVFRIEQLNPAGTVVDPSAPTTSPQTATSSTTSIGVNVTTSSAQVLASNATAKGRLFINDSDSTIYLKAGTTAALNSGIRLNANGGAWDGLVSGTLYTGRVDGIHGATGNKVLLITEV